MQLEELQELQRDLREFAAGGGRARRRGERTMADAAGPGPAAAYLYAGEGGIPWDAEEVEVDPSVPEIPDRLFECRRRLRSLLLREGLLRIGWQAFWGCSSLRSFRCPPTVTEIAWGAFNGCSNLAVVVLPEGLEEVERYTFQFCTSLREIRIPATVARIGKCAFWGCTNLGLVDLREGLRWVGNNAFLDCSSLGSLLFPSSVEEVGERAFKNCRNLSSVRLHEDLPRIGRFAFGGCTSLESFRFVRLSERMEAVSMDGPTRSVFDARLSEITLALTEEEEGEEAIWEEAEEEAENVWEKCKKSLGRAHEVLNYLELKGAAPVLELALWKAKIEGEGGGGVRGELIADEERGQDLGDTPRKKKRLKVADDLGQDSQLSREDCRVKCGAGIVSAQVLKFFTYSASWPRLADLAQLERAG